MFAVADVTEVQFEAITAQLAGILADAGVPVTVEAVGLAFETIQAMNLEALTVLQDPHRSATFAQAVGRAAHERLSAAAREAAATFPCQFCEKPISALTDGREICAECFF